MKNTGKMIRSAGDLILRLIFPERCIVCRKFIAGGYICPGCAEDKDTATVRRINIPMGKRSRLMEVHAPHAYVGQYRENIHRFKFSGITHYAAAIAQLILARVPGEVFENADLITFVPLHKSTRFQRGYDQSELVARELSKLTGIPTEAALRKIRKNRPQHTLSAKAREKNVKGVFSCEADIKGQNIILVDDIITTGETVSECAKLLFRAGAESLTGVCAASADR